MAYILLFHLLHNRTSYPDRLHRYCFKLFVRHFCSLFASNALSTPIAISLDCSSTATITAQVLPSKPVAASLYPISFTVWRTMLWNVDIGFTCNLTCYQYKTCTASCLTCYTAHWIPLPSMHLKLRQRLHRRLLSDVPLLLTLM